MAKIPSGKPAYIVCLLLIMLASLGCVISTSFMSAENYMPVINIGDGSAVVTFLISLVVLGIVLKCSEKAAKVTLAAWLSYFFFSQIYEFGTLFTTIMTIINGGAGGDINIWPMLIENAGVNISSTLFSEIKAFLSASNENSSLSESISKVNKIASQIAVTTSAVGTMLMATL